MSVAIRCRLHTGRTISCLRNGMLLSKLEALPKICCPYLIIQRETLLKTLTTSPALNATFGGKDGKGWSTGKRGAATSDQPKCPKCNAPCPTFGPHALDSSGVFLVECSNCKHTFVADVEECQVEEPGKKQSLTPKEISKHLSRYVIGQEDALQIMSTAIYNHWKKVTYNLARKAASKPERSILENAYTDMSAKNMHYRATAEATYTMLFKSKKPVRKSQVKKDMTQSLKQPSAMYPGEQGHHLPPASEAPEFNRDLINSPTGKLQHIQKSNLIMVGPTGSGKTLLAQSIANLLDVPFHIADCTSLTQAGYVGEDVENIIARLFQNANYDVGKCQQGIVVLDEVDKIATRQDGLRGTKHRDIAGEGVQQSLLKMIEGTTVNVSDKYHKNGNKETIDTTNILFVACGAFNGLDKVVAFRTKEQSLGFGRHKPKDKVATKHGLPIDDNSTESKNRESDSLLDKVNALDIVSYGFLPEFVGRFAGIVPFHTLSKKNLVQILLEAENSYIKEVTTLFKLDNCSLTVEPEALDAIAENCLENKMGARGLRQELEMHLKVPMFEVPGSDIMSVIITGKVVREGAPPIFKRRGDIDEPSKLSFQINV